MWEKERKKVGSIQGFTMYYLRKTQQLRLAVSLLLLLGFIVYPPLPSGGIGLAQANSALMAKNSSQRLIGTAVSIRDSADNFAVIEDIKSRQQWIYREGDLAGTTLIKKILPDQIIVDNGSGEVVVKLQRSLTGLAAGGSLATTASSSATAVKPKYDPTRKGGPRDRYYLINGQVFAETFANPNQLLDLVDMQPGKGLGQQKGVRLGAFAQESLFAAFGLRKGDLLLAINGQEIAAPGEAMAMLQTMLDDGQAELKVRRRARTYRFHLQTE
jgi:type II secretion system protein C